MHIVWFNPSRVYQWSNMYEMDGCQLIRGPCLLAICSHSVFARVLRVVKVIIGNTSYLCVSVSVRMRTCVCVCVYLSCCVWASRLEKQIISGRTGTDGGRRRKGTIMCSWCWSSGWSGPTQDVLCSICWASLIHVCLWIPFFLYWRICWCHLHCDSVSKHTGPF